MHQGQGPGNGPLSGVNVVDFTHVISGPFAAQTLGDLGASVTKIEGVARGDIGRDMAPNKNGQSHYFVAFNRNKRSVALDLKSREGKAVALALMSKADVVLENFAPGVMRRLGLAYDDVKAANSGLIYCSISGFGQTGPLANKRSLDLIAQAYSGIMSTNGEAGSVPLKVGVPIGDTAASLFSTIGILAALQERHRTGTGKYLDVAMYDALLTLLANYGGYFHATGEQPARVGSGHYFTVPYGTFAAADGQIALAVMTDASWMGVCRALDLASLGSDERLRTLAGRFEHREHIYAVLRPAMARLTVHQLISRLDAADVPCAPVHDIGDALQHAHTAARQMVLDLTHPQYGSTQVTSLPLRDVMRATHRPAPLHGEHTIEVLRELGIGDADIQSLLAGKHALQHGSDTPIAQTTKDDQ